MTNFLRVKLDILHKEFKVSISDIGLAVFTKSDDNTIFYVQEHEADVILDGVPDDMSREDYVLFQLDSAGILDEHREYHKEEGIDDGAQDREDLWFQTRER